MEEGLLESPGAALASRKDCATLRPRVLRSSSEETARTHGDAAEGIAGIEIRAVSADPGASAARRLAILGGDPAFERPLYVTRSLEPDPRIFESHVKDIFAARWFTNDGRCVRELEARLAERLGVGFCLVFCNGTVALQVALRALELSGEILTTPFTFPATVHAIQWNGLVPVFCDVDPATYNLDPRSAQESLSPATSGVLPVHVFGNPCDVEQLEKLAIDRQLRVLYDAAHCFGVETLDRSIGSWGDLSVLSFHATKLFHTAEGGAIVGSDPVLRKRISALRNFGILDEETVKGVGLNGKLSEVHAAIGLGLLERVDEEIERRIRLVQRYRTALEGVAGLRFQRLARHTRPNAGYFSVEVEKERFGLDRDGVFRALRAENVFARKYFFPLCSENESYRDLPSARPENLPHARRLASRILCLPLFGEMADADVDRIGELIGRIQREAGPIRAALG